MLPDMMLWGSVLIISLLTTLYALCLKSVQKRYLRERHDFFGFSFILNVFQSIVLLILPPYGALSFSRESLLYGTVFGAIILAYHLFMVLALAKGPLVLTNSILALYLIIPIIYGLFFWEEALTLPAVFGLILFLVSILLITNATYYEKSVEKKIEWKWLVLVLLAFACSGATSVISKQFAIVRPGETKEYLLVCRWVNIILSAAVYLVFRSRLRPGQPDRQPAAGHFKSMIRQLLGRPRGLPAADGTRRPDRTFILLSFAAATIMAVANTLFMMFVAGISSAFFFPATQALNILLMFFVSRIILKEQLSRKALAGYVMIALAIMILSLA